MIDIDLFYEKTPYLDGELPYFSLILNAKSFYYYSIYELGCGYHTKTWWKSKKDICYFFEDYTSDRKTKKYQSHVVRYRKIDASKFDVFIAILVKNNILNLKVKPRSILSNRNCYYYILSENGTFHGFQTGAGFEYPPKLEKIQEMIDSMESYSVRKGRKIKKRDGEDFYEMKI